MNNTMLYVGADEKLDETLGLYLINVLNIPQLWEEKKSLKQKDQERRELHNKLVKLLKIEDREIISQCTEEGAYPAYMKFGELRKAKNAFYHKFNVLTGNNLMTPEQETVLEKLYGELGNTLKVQHQIRKNLDKCFKTERTKYYLEIYENYKKMYSKMSPNEILEFLKNIPERYLKLYNDIGTRYSEWSKWFNTTNWEYGNGFACAFYDMGAYYYCHNFYHDYGQRVAVVKSGVKKWCELPEVIKWGVDTAARFQTWFDGAEEYLNTPFEKIIEIFLSFKDKTEEKQND